MALINNEDNIGSSGMGGYGYGGGGNFVWILLALVIFWLIFERKDGHRDGGYAYGGGCGIHGTRTAFYDESNYEEERNLRADYCNKTDKILDSEEKTRALIEKNYVQELRDKLTKQEMENMTLKSEMFIGAKFGEINHRLDRIDCEIPKKMPTFAATTVPCNTSTTTGCGGERREVRRGCGFEDGFGF
jgi:hypothetical protein